MSLSNFVKDLGADAWHGSNKKRKSKNTTPEGNKLADEKLLQAEDDKILHI